MWYLNIWAFLHIWFDPMSRGRPQSKSRGRSRSVSSRSRCPFHNVFVGADGVCGRCDARRQGEDQQEATTTNDDNSPVPPDNTNDSEMPELMVKCAKCCRTSTDEYKLVFQTCQRDCLHRTMFGKPVAEVEEDSVRMCQQCLQYNSNPDRHQDWPSAWPCVLYTLLFENHRFSSNAERFYKILPHEIKASFLQNINTVPPSINDVTESFLRDVTAEKEVFWTLISMRTAKSLIKALTKFSFPDIRCPTGCYEFIEKTIGISFAHFLSLLYPSFTSFNANSKKFLKGARYDFIRPLTLLEKFTISPCVINNDKGLKLVTCSDHPNGVLLQFVHVPTNPAIGNISPLFSDRLALMVSSVRTVRPLKIGSKSATFTMCRVDSGRVSGVSSTVLHKFRNFEIPLSDQFQNVEKLMINCRSDVKEVIRVCCHNGEMTERLAEGYLNYESPVSMTVVEDHCSNAVFFGMGSLMRMKDFVESSSDDMTSADECRRPLIFSHKLDEYGSESVSIPRELCRISVLFPFVFAFLHQDSLWSKLTEVSTEREELAAICQAIHRLRHHKSFSVLRISNGLQNSFLELFQPSTHPLPTLCEHLEGCLVISCNRNEVTGAIIDCSRHDTVLFVACETHGRDTQVPFELNSTNGKPFRLVFLANEEQLSLRYGPPFYGFWTVKNEGSRAKKDPMLEYQYNRNWKFLLYVSQNDLKEETKLRYLKYMGGQGVSFCQEHTLPLSTDYLNGNRKCSLPRNSSIHQRCTRKSAWRCPTNYCNASVCRTHFRDFCDVTDRVLMDNIYRDDPDDTAADSSEDEVNLHADQPTTSVCEIDTTERPVAPESNMDEFDCPELIVDAGFQDNEALATDSGCEPVCLSNDSKFVPMHVLLNGECHLLKRVKFPKHIGKNFQCFLQNFLSTLPGRSIPLLQPEACLFPSNFYKQMADGSFPGAMPFFLYDDRSRNSRLDFDGLHEHLRLRLKDASLLTSANLSYTMYAFDCVLNLSLTKCHTNQFFKRGLQTISIGKYRPRQLTSTESVLKMDSVDSDVHVNHLGTACASETPDLFVTFTCNQKEHPGVAEIVQAIYAVYGSTTTAELKEILQSYMVIIVRCWTRTIELLIDYLRFSDEYILGEIIKVRVRAEFQSAAANLQHYHILFWLKNSGDDVLDKIQCPQKHVFHAFKKLFLTDFGTVESLDHAGKLFDDCVRVQTHDCEKGHCRKKTSLQGQKKRRFPPYPQSHVPWYKEFHQPHSVEALEALQEIQLAEPRPNFFNELQVTPILKAGKYMYAAQRGEHMSPLNVPLWSIVKSSLNVLKVCKSVASHYLTSYAAGNEEHADVSNNPDNAHNFLNVEVQNIENKKLGGVRKILARETKQQKTQGIIDSTTIASTECVSWMLQLPTVITSRDFISVPTVSLENRGGEILKRKNSTQSRVNRPGIANEGPAEIRENHLNLPFQRRFTRSHKIVLESVKKTPFSTHKVTVFSLHPPELLFVDKLKLFFSWFVREKLPCKKTENVNIRFVKVNVKESHWVDGEILRYA